jgi:ABC-type transporter Mla subunit MlaD
MTRTTQIDDYETNLPPYLQVVLDTLEDPKQSTRQSLQALLQVLADRNETILRLKQEINQLNEALEEVKTYLGTRLGAPDFDINPMSTFTV